MASAASEAPIELGAAHLVPGSRSNVTLASSVTVLASATASLGNTQGVSYYMASRQALDAATYPSLAAIWDNDQDAIFDTL